MGIRLQDRNRPKHLIKSEVADDDDTIFGRIGAAYTSKRYYAYENDVSVGDRVIVDASVGYRWNGFELQASVNNLFDKDYVSTVGAGGFGNRAAFGSCAHQDKEQPIWEQVLAYDPELFIFLDDNIYGDTTDMAVLQAKYDKLAAKPGFQKLRAKSRIVATWDDHDFGCNDAGREYPKKAESKDIFLRFWQEPQGSPRWCAKAFTRATCSVPPASACS